MELLNRKKLRVVMCYPGSGIDFIKDRLDMVHGSRDVIIHVGENRNKYEMFEKSEILLRKYKDLLVRVREMGKKVCINGILPRLR